MTNYKEIYESIKTTQDFIRVVNEYDQFQLEKQSFTWDYSSPAFTYLGNIGTNFDYEIPPLDERAGVQGPFYSEADRKIHEPLKYTRGYDRYEIPKWIEPLVKFLKFDYEYQADINVQRLNTVKVLHYDNMSTFVINNPTLHDLPFDTKLRQPVHKWELKRVFVALQDWQDGWMFQTGNTQWVDWKKGDVIDFHWRGQPHSTANASFNERALFKISGFSNIEYFGDVTLDFDN